MCKEINKQAVELTKAFYKAIDKKVTPALMKQGIGQFKSLLNVYTLIELESVIRYIEDGNVPNVYSPGYLSYATNKLLDEIKVKTIKTQQVIVNSNADVTIKQNVNKKPSAFLEKFL